MNLFTVAAFYSVIVPVEICEEALPVKAARDGQPDAWDALFRRFQLPLYSYVRELVRDEQTSLDIVQESFVNAVKYISQLKQDEKFGSWLFGIAHQKVQLHWRKRSRSIEMYETASKETELENESPSDWLIQKEDEERFMKTLEQLSESHRSVLLLHFIENFKLDEIAEITNTPLGTVKSRLHHAKQSLRNLLRKEPL